METLYFTAVKQLKELSQVLMLLKIFLKHSSSTNIFHDFNSVPTHTVKPHFRLMLSGVFLVRR